MTQDFDQRISIVVSNELPTWQVLNVVGHISAYFGNQLRDNFWTGEYFEAKDGVRFPRNSQYPIIILGGTSAQLQKFATTVRDQDQLQSAFFIREMLETIDDRLIVEALAHKNSTEVDIFGVGVFGPNAVVKAATKPFSLWK